MSKLIAVYGSPSSGKTTLALKLAQEIYYLGKSSVIFLSPDVTVPSMSFIFPHCKDEDLFSLGKALDKTDIFKEDIIKQLVSVKTMMNFGFLGFKGKENKYSYPSPTPDKVLELFEKLRELADYIVVDCTSDCNDLISHLAITKGDAAIRIVNPDLKCMGFFASQGEFVSGTEEKTETVMNIQDKDVCLPIEEVKAHFKKVELTVPYSIALKQQMITGTLSERLSDHKYRGIVSNLAKKVI